MKKRTSTHKSTSAVKNLQLILNNYRDRDEEYLRGNFKSTKDILDRLSGISTSLSTYEFLGELFFNLTVHEMEQSFPSEEWIKQLKSIRFEVMEMYEMARATKMLRGGMG